MQGALTKCSAVGLAVSRGEKIVVQELSGSSAWDPTMKRTGRELAVKTVCKQSHSRVDLTPLASFPGRPGPGGNAPLHRCQLRRSHGRAQVGRTRRPFALPEGTRGHLRS